MIYDIRHITRFDYGAQVKYARCNLRLKPIDWPGQTLEAYDLIVEPVGRTRTARAEAGLAHVTRLVVDRPVRSLTIESRAHMVVDRPVPMPSPGDPTLAEVSALARSSRDLSAAGPANYIFPSALIPLDPAIAEWCAPDLSPERGALEAGFALAGRIQREFAFDPAATLVDTPPAEAFRQRRGVCQDFAQIMITGLRAAGIPAAYASGYIRTLPPPGQPRLVGADATHAWVLIWCGPERGWVGVDPTNGIWMAGDHIIVAVGRDYAEIAPVDGVVLGSGAQKMDVSVDVAPVGEMVAG
ncbi:transglutaminase-like putative cysteine protease [Sphingomonas sp. SORGH_AS 950]|uniref:transglutaminase family protein n=1 Tax=unclassified Sphingomonas TaxID=196159 RepID=UPI002782DC8A|nr:MULTISPECIES: transglutaminase family protein [unclassified Sphingomonas]MDQ1158492.1 transglutaminase-like putative cysteine protease [Sphingomonas sp. SORGH_AS_0950]MDR6145249.1 transglutaminase-like putative cysteine protease [Sphingomonas sp. SORGH_AS_0870]